MDLARPPCAVRSLRLDLRIEVQLLPRAGLCRRRARPAGFAQSERLQVVPGAHSRHRAALSVRYAILDGDIVHLDANGVPQFLNPMKRRSPQHYCAFDVLWLNGRDLRASPLVERKRLLREIVPPQPAPVMSVDHVAENGIALYEADCARDLEGIVAKLASAPYAPEETMWAKIKNPAYSQAEGRADLFEGWAFRAAAAR